MCYLEQKDFDVVLLQETRYNFDSEYETSCWMCVGSGTAAQKHAGVMVLINRRITKATEVKHEAVVRGRLLRVRFPIGQGGFAAKRHRVWHKISQCIRSIPSREMLVLGGDLNTQVYPHQPCVGAGTGILGG